MRILVVENDHDTLEVTTFLLGEGGHTVVAARTTAEALRHSAAAPFDLLATDLNLNRAGDGLVIAGAMRALHPDCYTALITGYPDFIRSLAEIQTALDEVLIKPVSGAALTGLPRRASRSVHTGRVGKLSLGGLIQRQKRELVSAWIDMVETDPALSAVPLSRNERLDHIGELLDSLWTSAAPTEEEATAAKHGTMRRLQDYSPELVAAEISHLRRAVFAQVLQHLLEIDLSAFPRELFALNTKLDHDLLRSLHHFGLRGG
ncbi:MAG: response regulator [Terriglobales bacterium]